MILALSIVAIAVIIVCSLDMIFAAPVFEISPWFFVAAVLLSVVYVVAVDGLFAFITKMFPEKWVSIDKKFFDVSKGEQRFYEKLGVKKWKDKYLELGGIGGFSKKKLVDPENPEYVKLFLIESNKGLLDHLCGIIFGFSVVLIFPIKYALVVGLPVAIVNAFMNYMSVMILRYNTPKLKVLYKRALRNAERKQQEEIEKQ